MFDLALERLVIFALALLHAHYDIAVHLQEPAIRIPCETGVAGFLGNYLHHFVIHSEIEDRVHHPGHGIAPERTETRSGCSLSPSFLPTDFSTLTRADSTSALSCGG